MITVALYGEFNILFVGALACLILGLVFKKYRFAKFIFFVVSGFFFIGAIGFAMKGWP
jgi:hypothetical protein